MIGLKFEFPKRNTAVTVFFKRQKARNFWDLALKLYQSFQDASESEPAEAEDRKKKSSTDEAKVPRKRIPVSTKPKRVSSSSTKKKTSPLLGTPRPPRKSPAK